MNLLSKPCVISFFSQCGKTSNIVNQAWKWANETCEPLLPPRVAEMRMWVPYFLMIVSMNCWVVGLRPSRRTLRWNSGMSGTGFRIRSLLSIAVFLTFQRANSLQNTSEKHALNNIPYITLLTITININNAATLLIEILSEKLVHTGVFHVNTTVWGNKTLKKILKTEANNEDALYSLVFIQSGTTMHNHCCLVCNLTSFLRCSSVMQYVFLKTAQGHFLFIMLWLNSQERKYKNTQCTKKKQHWLNYNSFCPWCFHVCAV